MVTKKKETQCKDVIMIKEFIALYSNLPTYSFGIRIVKMDWASIKKYYKLKKELKRIYKCEKRIYSIISRLPKNIWLLKSQLHNILFFIVMPVLFVIYLNQVPSFFGKIGWFVGFSFFLYYFIISRLSFISQAVYHVTRELLDEINKNTSKSASPSK